ncbi:MAG: TetR family transcriptional regulator [Candidatus Latescibacteria bacterium]|nr:TetR family transcriptional regulator [Candidatus Latescibacterota bacterium]
MTQLDTKERLMDAAEELFAQQGIAATSLRRVTAQAQANLASVKYHFGSKNDLVQAVYARRIEPINGERLRLLDQCQQLAAPGVPQLEEVVEAFIAPPLRLCQSREKGGADSMRLMGRLYAEPGEIRLLVHRQFEDVAHRFRAALEASLPQLASADIMWGFFFSVGTMAHTMMAGQMLDLLTQGQCDTGDVEDTIQRLQRFAVAGLRACGPEEEAH